MTDFGSTEISATNLDGTPSGATLSEMIVAQYEALSAAQASHGRFSRTAAAHEATLRKLFEEAQAVGPARAMSAFDRAVELSDVSRFSAAEDSPKALLMKGLKPFHIEALRPQEEFNRALVAVLKSLLNSPSSNRDWVRQRLAPLADPTAWQVKSHREQITGQLIEFTKKVYLKALGPLLEVVLARQREWNQKAIAILEQLGHGDTAGLLADLDALSCLVAPGAAFVWHEMLQGQIAFNQHVFSMLADPLALRARAYPDWVAAREKLRVAALKHVPAATFLVLLPASDIDGVKATLASVRAQTVSTWEVQLVGSAELDDQAEAQLRRMTDARVHFTRTAPTPKSDWVTLIEAGDLLAPNAFAEVAALAGSELEIVFSDEDRLDERGIRSAPFFKPDLAVELLSSCDLVSRGLFVRSRLFRGLRELNDVVWRTIESGGLLGHVSEVLYTRADGSKPRSQDFVSDAGRRALDQHLQRGGVKAAVEVEAGRYRVRSFRSTTPLVSIIVPFKDKPDLLKTLLQSLETATAYQNFELILVSNNSVEPETIRMLEGLSSDPRVTTMRWDHPFHYPKLNNFAARQARGELLLFLNNDIEAFDPGWLDALVDRAVEPGVGAVGPKLLFPDRTIQHAGVVVGMNGFAGHVFAGVPDDGQWTPFGTADWSRDCLAVTSACLMMRRNFFEELKGFDERFIVCGSDVDLCLRVRTSGKRVVYTPHSVLFHHESASRQGARIPSSDFWESFRAYQAFLTHDPGFSPRLSLASTDPWLRPPDEPSALDAALQVLTPSGGISGGRTTYVRRVQGMVEALDFGSKDLLARAPSSDVPKRLTWFLPFFDHPFGGIHTILRFADFWRRNHGVENRFVVYDNPHVTAREMEAKVAVLFPEQPGSFEILKHSSAVEDLPECDVGIATMWSGAYFLLRHRRARQRAYFIQDYEPMFYPAGTLSALATNTYEMGFLGLFNTRGLHDYVTAHHPMTGAWFEPAVDHGLFHARGRTTSHGPVRVFFYARPSIDRNAFELGIEALRQLKALRGDGVEIFAAGEQWDSRSFDAHDVLENLGVLPYKETPRQYRNTDVGLCFMFTRHPSYLPLEMMACGVAVVTNQNVANDGLFVHRHNCLLARPTASCVAEQLVEAVANSALRERIGVEASRRMQTAQWDEQAEKIWWALSKHVMTAAPGKEAS